MSRKFYLRDSRSNVGSTCMFWAEAGGYTSNLDLAEVFTKESAQQHFDGRHTDVPLCKELVDEESVVRVDHQYLKQSGKSKGCTEYVVRVGQRCNGNDVYWLTVDFSSVNYKAAAVFSYESALQRLAELKEIGSDGTIYAKSHVDSVARRTFQANNINERRMITAAGIRKPKRKRRRAITGRTRGNCPHCGKVTWGMNPYEAYTCVKAENERSGWERFSTGFEGCADVAEAKKARKEAT